MPDPWQRHFDRLTFAAFVAGASVLELWAAITAETAKMMLQGFPERKRPALRLATYLGPPSPLWMSRKRWDTFPRNAKEYVGRKCVPLSLKSLICNDFCSPPLDTTLWPLAAAASGDRPKFPTVSVWPMDGSRGS